MNNALNDTVLNLVSGGLSVEQVAERRANQVDASRVFAQNSHDHYKSSKNAISALLSRWSSLHFRF